MKLKSIHPLIPRYREIMRIPSRRAATMQCPSPGKAAEAPSVHYKGVRMRKWGKWVAEVRLPNIRDRIWLGSYDTPDKAARAYDAAVLCLRGPEVQFNFPDDLPDIPRSNRSLTKADIREVAVRHANEAARVLDDDSGGLGLGILVSDHPGHAVTRVDEAFLWPESVSLECFGEPPEVFSSEWFFEGVWEGRVVVAEEEEEDSDELYQFPSLWSFQF